MSVSNKGPGVDSRLQNLTNALYVDGNDDIVVRTGFAGDIVISGNVNIPGEVTVVSDHENPVHCHVENELGTSLSVYGNVTVDGNANVVVAGNIGGITTLPAITGNVGVSGNVSISQLPGITVTNFPSNVSITSLPGITVTNFPSNVRITDLPGITGNVNIADGGNSITVDGNISITTMPAITGNVSIPTDIVQADSTYELNLARGLIDGQYVEMKNGVALDLSQGAEATVWSQNTLYPWASWTTAQKLYTISSSASDTGQVLRIEGLDANFAKITEDVTTNGTTAVATTQNFLRLNRCYMLTGATNVGTITQRLASGVGTVVGSMAIGYSRNKGAFFTVPAGYTAYILYGDATSFRGGSGNIGCVIKMFTRTNVTGVTTPFMNQFMSEVVNGQYRNEFNIPLQVPEKTDIDVRMVADGNNTQATCNWQMILIPNT